MYSAFVQAIGEEITSAYVSAYQQVKYFGFRFEEIEKKLLIPGHVLLISCNSI